MKIFPIFGHLCIVSENWKDFHFEVKYLKKYCSKKPFDVVYGWPDETQLLLWAQQYVIVKLLPAISTVPVYFNLMGGKKFVALL